MEEFNKVNKNELKRALQANARMQEDLLLNRLEEGTQAYDEARKHLLTEEQKLVGYLAELEQSDGMADFSPIAYIKNVVEADKEIVCYTEYIDADGAMRRRPWTRSRIAYRVLYGRTTENLRYCHQAEWYATTCLELFQEAITSLYDEVAIDAKIDQILTKEGGLLGEVIKKAYFRTARNSMNRYIRANAKPVVRFADLEAWHGATPDFAVGCINALDGVTAMDLVIAHSIEGASDTVAAHIKDLVAGSKRLNDVPYRCRKEVSERVHEGISYAVGM